MASRLKGWKPFIILSQSEIMVLYWKRGEAYRILLQKASFVTT